jgi:hypothetical protein
MISTISRPCRHRQLNDEPSRVRLPAHPLGWRPTTALRLGSGRSSLQSVHRTDCSLRDRSLPCR